MLDSKTMAATLAAAIAVAVLGVGFGLMQPPSGGRQTHGPSATQAQPNAATPGPGLRGWTPTPQAGEQQR
jgi:hypothetical protein